MDELEEIVGDQAGPADESAINVFLRCDFPPVAGIHTAAVEDADGFRGAAVVELGNESADGGDGFAGLRWTGVDTGADGPDGLVGNDDEGDLGGCDRTETGADLLADDGVGLTGFLVLKRFANTEDGDDVVIEGGTYFLAYKLAGLSEYGAALGMANDDEGGELAEHGRRNLTSEGA